MDLISDLCPFLHLNTLRFKCLTPGFKQMGEIPYGNPWFGGKWHGTEGKDTGDIFEYFHSEWKNLKS